MNDELGAALAAFPDMLGPNVSGLVFAIFMAVVMVVLLRPGAGRG